MIWNQCTSDKIMELVSEIFHFFVITCSNIAHDLIVIDKDFIDILFG